MQPKRLVFLLFILLAHNAWGQAAVIDSLQRLIASGKHDSTEVAANLTLADEYARRDMAAAKLYCNNAVFLSAKLNLFVQLSAAYSILVTLHQQTNQADSSKYYLARLKNLATQYPRNSILANYNITAGLFYRKQGNYKASQPFMFEALRLVSNKNNKLAMAGQNLNIGNNYVDMSEYRNAMTYHLKALDLFEVLGNKRGASFCYSAIGGDFIKLKQPGAALPYINKSIALKDELNDKRGKAAAYLSLGEIQEGLGHTDKALESYQKALAINQALHLSIEEAKTELSIGKLYANEKDGSKAAKHFNLSKTLFKSLGDTTFLAAINAEMASLQKKNNKQGDDEKTFINSLATSKRMGDKNSEINNYRFLSELYAKKKLYAKALRFNEKYHAEADSVQNKDLQLQVKRLEQQFNLEKKEREITLLKKDRLLDQVTLQNQKIFRYAAVLFILMLIIIGLLVMARYRVVQKARRLIEIEKMRNHIARNLHDDIGSTLSSINILSKVALNQVGENKGISRELEKIKDSSFNIMESMSDIVWAINPANDPLDKTILKMRDFAAFILEPIGIGFRFDENGKLNDVKLSVDERKNFYLIFKEAINNIAKYSGATVASILLQKNDGQFLLKVADNGKGFDHAKQHNGNGLKNMRSRAAEMNAVFEVISDPVQGTTICVTMPIT